MKRMKASRGGGQGAEEKALTASPRGGKSKTKAKGWGTENSEKLR
jgi:hypothetical protein